MIGINIESSINRYLRALDNTDRQESVVAQPKTECLHGKIAAVRTKMQELKAI